MDIRIFCPFWKHISLLYVLTKRSHAQARISSVAQILKLCSLWQLHLLHLSCINSAYVIENIWSFLLVVAFYCHMFILIPYDIIWNVSFLVCVEIVCAHVETPMVLGAMSFWYMFSAGTWILLIFCEYVSPLQKRFVGTWTWVSAIGKHSLSVSWSMKATCCSDSELVSVTLNCVITLQCFDAGGKVLLTCKKLLAWHCVSCIVLV